MQHDNILSAPSTARAGSLKENTMTRTLSRPTATALSVTALASLALTSCGLDDTLDTSADGEPSTAVTISADDAAHDDAAASEDGSADAGGSETSRPEDDASAEGEGTDPSDDTATDAAAETSPADSDDHPLYGGLETVQAEYPEGVVFEVESDDGRYEWHVLVDGIEREVHTDKSSLEIVYTEDDDAPDSDDLREIDSTEIDIAEAFRIVEDRVGDPSGAFVDEAQLDSESGTVVWEIELDNGQEIAVDVVTGDLVQVDD
ncbi:PepSY domain-containing protein [Nesterenkonia sp. PF2B19]|uniref:PepSY domain-containing protein n=2 Tax=unclassified Nesterenkonia TaxID=2629769 RepID=UPI0008720A08|nr:PepSY domain-containing protein [Nesterenkonia sp. PF2B19]